jgi:hypothetical protein
VFGAMNTIEDWKNRGEYYLQNADGERQRGWYVNSANNRHFLASALL